MVNFNKLKYSLRRFPRKQESLERPREENKIIRPRLETETLFSVFQ